jgi:hypothetical protein
MPSRGTSSSKSHKLAPECRHQQATLGVGGALGTTAIHFQRNQPQVYGLLIRQMLRSEPDPVIRHDRFHSISGNVSSAGRRLGGAGNPAPKPSTDRVSGIPGRLPLKLSPKSNSTVPPPAEKARSTALISMPERLRLSEIAARTPPLFNAIPDTGSAAASRSIGMENELPSMAEITPETNPTWRRAGIEGSLYADCRLNRVT